MSDYDNNGMKIAYVDPQHYLCEYQGRDGVRVAEYIDRTTSQGFVLQGKDAENFINGFMNLAENGAGDEAADEVGHDDIGPAGHGLARFEAPTLSDLVRSSPAFLTKVNQH